LAADFALSNLFQELTATVQPKLVAAFLTRELSAILNHDNLLLEDLNLDPNAIAELLKLLEEGKITEKNAKEAMIAFVQKKIRPSDFIQLHGLLNDMGERELEIVIERILKENPMAADDYRRGEAKALNFLVGVVMRETKGKADPKKVQKTIEERVK